MIDEAANDTPASARAGRREAARLRKALSRERARARAAVTAAALAVAMENQHEWLAPAAMRNSVLDHAGNMISGARVQIVNGLPIRSSGLPNNTPTQHKMAAARLQADFSDVGNGLNAPAIDYGAVGGGRGDGLGGFAAMLAQLDTRRRLEGALTSLGACASGVARVVLDCIPTAVWAPEAGLTPIEAAAWISAGMTKLVSFYWPEPADGRANRIRTAAFSK
ncbi:hypothetical protein [Rhodopila sp.]|uniref:hypothetical protein n=1 Tax=Rhodopila sp. TaxID=2480087 RepID=UPI003D0BAFB5